MIWINQFREIILNATKSRCIYRFWHFSMQNLFIMNRFEHIESKKSVDFIIYNQYKILDVFVRIRRNENTILFKTQFEQWIRINLILSRIENINIDKKNANHSITNWRILNLTNIQFAQWTRNKFNEHAIYLTNS